MTHYNSSNVIWALEVLSDRNEQSRLWLSDGSSGEVWSFDEAVCEVFNAGVIKELDSGKIPEPLYSMFRDLRNTVKLIPMNAPPQQVIDHTAMTDVRRVALELVQQLRINLTT